MLHIKCDHCGQDLKGREVIVTPFYAYIEGSRYQDYAVTCSKCGGIIVWDRYAQKAAENKAKAVRKAAGKKGKTVKQITEAEQYNAIALKAYKRAEELALLHKHSHVVTMLDFNQAIEELPQSDKAIMLDYEDKQDMLMLKMRNHKPTKHIKSNSILLLTQAIIESAIEEQDEDFFKAEYGAFVGDTYNTTLTVHKCHDYGITAELLLEKMRKKSIQIQGEE